MRPLLTVLFLLSMGLQCHAKGKFALKESISTHIKLSGDLSDEFDFDGMLGSEIEGTPSKPESVCAARAIFRKSLYRSRPALEFWLTLECTIEGQKRSYKPHRIFLDPSKTEQDIRLPMLASNLKKVRIEFQNLSLVKSK